MPTAHFYTSPEWRRARALALVRDGSRCTVARLLGGRCAGALHVHHIEPVDERPDLALDVDNLGVVCATHHPRWEALARGLRRHRRQGDLPPCPHRHPYPEGREACDRRRRRELLLEPV